MTVTTGPNADRAHRAGPGGRRHTLDDTKLSTARGEAIRASGLVKPEEMWGIAPHRAGPSGGGYGKPSAGPRRNPHAPGPGPEERPSHGKEETNGKVRRRTDVGEGRADRSPDLPKEPANRARAVPRPHRRGANRDAPPAAASPLSRAGAGTGLPHRQHRSRQVAPVGEPSRPAGDERPGADAHLWEVDRRAALRSARPQAPLLGRAAHLEAVRGPGHERRRLGRVTNGVGRGWLRTVPGGSWSPAAGRCRDRRIPALRDSPDCRPPGARRRQPPERGTGRLAITHVT